MHTPLLQRIRKRPAPLRLTTTLLPGGGVATDFGEALAQLDWAEILRQAGLRGKV